MKKILGLLLVCSLMVVCEDDYDHNPINKGGVKPNPVSNVKFVPIHGGFDISYDLSTSKDVLYVKAIYTNSKGKEAEVRSSNYTNKIQILGFGDTGERTVTLYTVSKSDKTSDPISFKGNPLTPPVTLIQNKITISSDFGGAKFKWTNKENTPIAIMLLAEGRDKKLEVAKTVYTSQSETDVSLRGREPTPQKFAVLIRDRYDNFSDTIYPTSVDKLITPLFEERLDKKLFNKIVLSDDTNWDAWGGNYSYFYDDKKEGIVHTQGNHPFPQIYSIDLGVIVSLSRFNLLQRQNHPFKHGNPKRYTVYGAKELPADDGNLDNWIFLRECESIKPSGLPMGQNTDEDMAHFRSGDEFTFDDAPEIRYFRLAVTETWDGVAFINAAELTFWGSISN